MSTETTETTETKVKKDKKQKVTPFEATNITNYEKLVEDFGCELINQTILERFEKLTLIKVPIAYQKFIISHRDFDKILDAYEKKEPFYLYTGRGPSSDRMHLGHLIPFRFTKFLQDAFQVPVVIQITDDEKTTFKGLQLSKVKEMAKENIKDIIAVGFDSTKTFIFLNSEFISTLYPMMLRIGQCITLNQIMSTFGFEKDSTIIGKVNFPVIQMAPAFAETFETIDSFKEALKNSQTNETNETKRTKEINLRKVRCLIPCAIDQDPYFRLTRSIAKKLKHPKPAVIHTRFLCGLNGVETKMSASDPKTCIYVGESKKSIKKKIATSFSGGKQLLEEHKKFGGVPENDVSFQLLSFFGDNPKMIENLAKEFRKGNFTCSDMKQVALEAIDKVLSEFKETRMLCDKKENIQKFML